MMAPICYFCFEIVRAHKIVNNKEFKTMIWTILGVAILVAIVSVSAAGSIERYLVDYAWLFIIDGILIFSIIYDSYKTEEAKKMLQKLLCIISIFTFVFSIQAGIISEKDFFRENSPKEYYKIKYTVCFWE